MSKILMRLHLPEPKVRKVTTKTEQKHKDKSKYTRKHKHKGPGASPRGLCFLSTATPYIHCIDTPLFRAYPLPKERLP